MCHCPCTARRTPSSVSCVFSSHSPHARLVFLRYLAQVPGAPPGHWTDASPWHPSAALAKYPDSITRKPIPSQIMPSPHSAHPPLGLSQAPRAQPQRRELLAPCMLDHSRRPCHSTCSMVTHRSASRPPGFRTSLHLRQEELPRSSANQPVLHTSHPAIPVRLAKRPSPHRSQVLLPVPPAMVPTRQGSQANCPKAAVKCPSGHVWHPDCPSPAPWEPAEQGWQVGGSSSLKCPAARVAGRCTLPRREAKVAHDAGHTIHRPHAGAARSAGGHARSKSDGTNPTHLRGRVSLKRSRTNKGDSNW